jgi:hypothetical protein
MEICFYFISEWLLTNLPPELQLKKLLWLAIPDKHHCQANIKFHIKLR